MMKKLLTTAFVLCYFVSRSQTELKNPFSEENVEKLNYSIVAYAGKYKLLKVDSSQGKLRTYFFLITGNEELQITYLKDGAMYSILKIAAPFTTGDLIYRQYFGREYDPERAKKVGQDSWKTKSNGRYLKINFSQVKNEPGYWIIRIL